MRFTSFLYFVYNAFKCRFKPFIAFLIDLYSSIVKTPVIRLKSTNKAMSVSFALTQAICYGKYGALCPIMVSRSLRLACGWIPNGWPRYPDVENFVRNVSRLGERTPANRPAPAYRFRTFPSDSVSIVRFPSTSDNIYYVNYRY